MSWLGALAFFTTGYLLNASRAGPVAAHTKSGPRMPASQKSRSLPVMFARMSSRTLLSHPGRAAARFLQTIHTDDDRAAEEIARLRFPRSV